LEQLRRADVNVLGVVINRASLTGDLGYYYEPEGKRGRRGKQGRWPATVSQAPAEPANEGTNGSGAPTIPVK
jgi:Mrp family chromosome partitioning ATPase